MWSKWLCSRSFNSVGHVVIITLRLLFTSLTRSITMSNSTEECSRCTRPRVPFSRGGQYCVQCDTRQDKEKPTVDNLKDECHECYAEDSTLKPDTLCIFCTLQRREGPPPFSCASTNCDPTVTGSEVYCKRHWLQLHPNESEQPESSSRLCKTEHCNAQANSCYGYCASSVKNGVHVAQALDQVMSEKED